MAEEKAATPPPKGKGGLVPMVIVVVLALVGGIAVDRVVLKPKMEEKGAEPVTKEETSNLIPAESESVKLPEVTTSVRNDDSNRLTVLMYAETISCANKGTKELVEKQKDYFVAMLADIHANRTKAELADLQSIKRSLAKQAKEEANSLLRRFELEKKGEEELAIIEVLYTKFEVFDQP